MRQEMKRVGVVFLVFFFSLSGMSMASTKDDVVRRGRLQCGVSTGVPGFSDPGDKGNWSGLNIDICRAVAAAVLGNASKVTYTPLTDKEGYPALLSGNVDILVRNTPWTYTRDTALGVSFVGTSYFDGPGLLVAGKMKKNGFQDLQDAKVCIRTGSREEPEIALFFNQNHIEYKKVPVDSMDKAIKGFESGSCTAIAGTQSQLYGLQRKLSNTVPVSIISDPLTMEPVGPIVRQGDDGWFAIVKWSLYAMIDAEELGITSKNINEMKARKEPEIRSFIGKDDVKGISLGLHDDWAFQIIKQVGNYEESFARNIGQDSVLKGERGLNRLWNKGGLLWAPPIR